MMAKIMVLAILALSLATYASSPVTGASPMSKVACCDGDPGGPPQ